MIVGFAFVSIAMRRRKTGVAPSSLVRCMTDTAIMPQEARQSQSLDITLAFGRAYLFPECKVTTSGYKPEIDAGRWLIAEVAHGMTDRGFTTALKLESHTN